MTFTALLPTGVDLPEETWLTARVRRHGSELEVSPEEPSPPQTDSARMQALKDWLAHCAAQPAVSFTDEELDDFR